MNEMALEGPIFFNTEAEWMLFNKGKQGNKKNTIKKGVF
jgi:hypothetical protein